MAFTVGGVIVPEEPIPTMGEWGLIITLHLLLILGIVSVRHLLYQYII